MTGKQYMIKWIFNGEVVQDVYDDYDSAKKRFDALDSIKQPEDVLKMYSRIVTSWQEVKWE